MRQESLTINRNIPPGMLGQRPCLFPPELSKEYALTIRRQSFITENTFSQPSFVFCALFLRYSLDQSS